MTLNDTIAAVSTPRGKGGIAVIRISGSEAFAIAERVFEPMGTKRLSELRGFTAAYGKMYRDADRTKAPIDDGVATVYRSPRSFTGEDTVELSCHGGLLCTENLLAAVLAAGARHAEAGEFTRRAFVNGKMKLSETEALANLLEAKNASQLKLARSGMEGKIEKKCDGIYENLRSVLAALYAKIDYPDEDLAEIGNEEMLESVKAAAVEIQALADTYSSGHAIAEGVKTVICGRPNVGKSSLYNAIVGRDAAIVTDIEGTTRDVLEETASLGGVTLRLCDTAGLRASEDKVEMIGVKRAYEKLEEAELVLAVFDGSSPLSDEDRELISRLSCRKDSVVAVINKCELAPIADRKELLEVFGEVVEISARSEDGIDALAKAVENRYLNKELDLENDAVVFGARQYAALSRALEELHAAEEILNGKYGTDAAAFAVEGAMGALAELDGRQIGEDIVSEIFSHFCVGK